MKEFKVGDWATDTNDNETFLILMIGAHCIPMSDCSIDAYFDIYYDAHITYHCEAAKQEDIERVCAEMLELEFKTD